MKHTSIDFSTEKEGGFEFVNGVKVKRVSKIFKEKIKMEKQTWRTKTWIYHC